MTSSDDYQWRGFMRENFERRLERRVT